MSLIKYSALTAKIRAMEGRLLDADAYNYMSHLGTVEEAVAYVSKLPEYKKLFDGIDTSTLHRADIEKLLIISKYSDFAKLYKFASIKQREFLKTYFRHYELLLIRRCLHDCYSDKRLDLNVKELSDSFKKHSRIDVDALLNARDIEAFARSLSDSDYGRAVSTLSNLESPSLLDYELVLDQTYFKLIWNSKNRFLSAAESADLRACTGTSIDMLNLQWIYRSKKYYNMNSAQIYSLLLPYYYKLKKSDVEKMVNAENIDELNELITSGYYGRLAGRLSLNPSNISHLSDILLDRIYRSVERRHPYSASSIISYLYQKEKEVTNITHIIEAIRYKLSPQETLNKVLQQGLRRIAQ